MDESEISYPDASVVATVASIQQVAERASEVSQS